MVARDWVAQKSLRHFLSGGQEEPPKDKSSSLLLSGAAAGGVSKLLTAPIDRVKIMYHFRDPCLLRLCWHCYARKIVKEAGIMALWRGNSIVMRDIPYAAIIFVSSHTGGDLRLHWQATRRGHAHVRRLRRWRHCHLPDLSARHAASTPALSGRQPTVCFVHGRHPADCASRGVHGLFIGLRPTSRHHALPALSFAAFETLRHDEEPA